MDKIITATGKNFDSDYVATIPYPEMAFIRILGVPIGTVAEIFSDKTETETITYRDYVLTGYTKLLALVIEGDAVKVNLAKEAFENGSINRAVISS